MRHYAPVIRAALNHLDVFWNDRVAVFNAEAANLVDLSPIAPGRGLNGKALYFGGHPAHADFPAVEIGVTDGASRGHSIQQRQFDSRIDLTVAVWVEGETAEVPELYERSLGYGRIVQELLTQPLAFGGEVTIPDGGTVRDSYDAIPRGQPDENREYRTYRCGAFVFFELQGNDSRPD